MARVTSFAPITVPTARLLILGTMPGTASLAAHRYYAHPRNAFWPIVLGLLAQRPLEFRDMASLSFAERYAALQNGGIALWDVLAECVRAGSLDTAIRRQSIRLNDLAAFTACHLQLEAVAFNGQTAARLYARHAAASVSEVLNSRQRQLELRTLPSTSPAMARLDLAAKRALWHQQLGPFLPGGSALST